MAARNISPAIRRFFDVPYIFLGVALILLIVGGADLLDALLSGNSADGGQFLGPLVASLFGVGLLVVAGSCRLTTIDSSRRRIGQVSYIAFRLRRKTYYFSEIEDISLEQKKFHNGGILVNVRFVLVSGDAFLLFSSYKNVRNPEKLIGELRKMVLQQ